MIIATDFILLLLQLSFQSAVIFAASGREETWSGFQINLVYTFTILSSSSSLTSGECNKNLFFFFFLLSYSNLLLVPFDLSIAGRLRREIQKNCEERQIEWEQQF